MKLLISVFYLDYNYAITHITLDLSTRRSHVHYRFENYLPFRCFWNKNHLKWLALGNDIFFFFLSFFSFVKQLGLLWCSRSPSLPLPAVHRHSNKARNTLSQLRCRTHFWQTSVQYDSPYYTLNTNFFFGNLINFASLHFYLHWDGSIGICSSSDMHNF